MAEGLVLDLKYKGVAPEIAAELQGYEIQYFRQDLPVPFCGLKIYPALVKEYEAFANCSSCLTLNKNTTLDGLRMSNLDFLISKTVGEDNEASMWAMRLQHLFEIVFHIENGIKCVNCGHVIPYNSQEFREYAIQVQKNLSEGKDPEPPACSQCGGHEEKQFIEMIKVRKPEGSKHYELLVDGKVITSEDFDRFRQIVLFQNYPDYRDDSWVDPALKADYEAKMELERKNNDLHATIEKKVVCLHITTSNKIDEIWNMSIRHFTMALTAVDDLINYKIIKSASMSGFVSFPKGYTIEHWIYKPEKDMYGNAYRDLSTLTSANV